MDLIRSKKRLSFANKKKTKFANRQVDEIYFWVHFRFFHVLNQQSKQSGSGAVSRHLPPFFSAAASQPNENTSVGLTAASSNMGLPFVYLHWRIRCGRVVVIDAAIGSIQQLVPLYNHKNEDRRIGRRGGQIRSNIEPGPKFRLRTNEKSGWSR